MAASANQDVQLIQSPHKNDVLCGRGGGINNHPGNVNYRSIVHIYKTDYNLATNKQVKSEIARTVIRKVRELKPPGRFLEKNNLVYQVVSEEQAMKKTSQALREGAPSIRAMAVQGNMTKNQYTNGKSAAFTAKDGLGKTSSSRPRRQASSNTSAFQQSHPAHVGGKEKELKRGKVKVQQVRPLNEVKENHLKREVSKTTMDMLAGKMVPVKAGNDMMAIAMKQAKKVLADHHATQAALWAADKREKMIEREEKSDIKQKDEQFNGKSQIEPRKIVVDQEAATPPVSPRISALRNESDPPQDRLGGETLSVLPPNRKSMLGLKRSHSLAISDFDESEGISQPAKNPFQIEREPLNHTAELPPSHPKLLRDISGTDVQRIKFNGSSTNSSSRSFSISVTQLTDLSGLDKSTSLRRMNSLALSDIDNGEMDSNQSFQDPFGNESPLVSNKKSSNQVHAESERSSNNDNVANSLSINYNRPKWPSAFSQRTNSNILEGC